MSVFRERVSITYEGPAVDDGTMDVELLAGSMLATAALVRQANIVLYGEDAPPVSVRIAATGYGSFSVDLDLVQSFLRHVLDLFAGRDGTALSNLQMFLFGSGSSGVVGGVIWLIKRLRGRQPDRVEPVGTGAVRLFVGDSALEVPVEVFRLYREKPIRKLVEELVEPLREEGITGMQVRSRRERGPGLRIDREDVEAFRVPEEPAATVVDEVQRRAFRIVRLSFDEKGKWELDDGEARIWATIEDRDFLERVAQNRVRFAKGDLLVCEVRVIQKSTPDGLKTEYRIIRVLKHIPAPQQLQMLDDGTDGNR